MTSDQADERPPRLSRAEQQARTRSALIEAAADAFAERGVHGSSVEDICTRAGFSRGAFYSNFADKEDLFLAVLEDQQARYVAVITAMFNDDPDPSTLVERLRQRAPDPAAVRNHLLHIELRAHAIRNPATRERLAAFDRHQRSGFRAAVEFLSSRLETELPADSDLVALMVQAMLDGIAQRHHYDDSLSPDADLDALALFLQAFTVLAAQAGDTDR